MNHPENQPPSELPAGSEPPQVYALKSAGGVWRADRRGVLQAAAAGAAAAALPVEAAVTDIKAHDGAVTDLAVIGNELLASCGRDGRVALWKLPDGKGSTMLHVYSSTVRWERLASAGKTLFASMAAGKGKLWKDVTAPGKPAAEDSFVSLTEPMALAWDTDSMRLYALDKRNSTQIGGSLYLLHGALDGLQPEISARLKDRDHTYRATAVGPLESVPTLALVPTEADTTLEIISLKDGALKRVKLACETQPCAIALSPKNAHVAVGTKGGEVLLISLSAEGSEPKTRIISKRGATMITPRISDQSAIAIRCLEFSPDGTRLAIGDSKGGLRLVEDTAGESSEKVLALQAEVEHQGALNAIRFFDAGSAVATCGDDGVIRLWRLSGSGKPSVTVTLNRTTLPGYTSPPSQPVGGSTKGGFTPPSGRSPGRSSGGGIPFTPPSSPGFPGSGGVTHYWRPN